MQNEKMNVWILILMQWQCKPKAIKAGFRFLLRQASPSSPSGWGAACLSDSKGTVILGWFQEISQILVGVVATGGVICDRVGEGGFCRFREEESPTIQGWSRILSFWCFTSSPLTPLQCSNAIWVSRAQTRLGCVDASITLLSLLFRLFFSKLNDIWHIFLIKYLIIR